MPHLWAPVLGKNGGQPCIQVECHSGRRASVSYRASISRTRKVCPCPSSVNLAVLGTSPLQFFAFSPPILPKLWLLWPQHYEFCLWFAALQPKLQTVWASQQIFFAGKQCWHACTLCYGTSLRGLGVALIQWHAHLGSCQWGFHHRRQRIHIAANIHVVPPGLPFLRSTPNRKGGV